MLSKLRSKLGLEQRKAEKTSYADLKTEKEHRSNRSSETIAKKNMHRSPQALYRSDVGLSLQGNEQGARTLRCRNFPTKNNPNDELPSYHSSQNSGSTSGYQPRLRFNERETEYNEPPSYPLPQNLTSNPRCQPIEKLIKKRKDKIRLLEEQVGEETGKEVPLSAVRILQEEGVEQPNLQYYIQLCNKSRNMMIKT